MVSRSPRATLVPARILLPAKLLKIDIDDLATPRCNAHCDKPSGAALGSSLRPTAVSPAAATSDFVTCGFANLSPHQRVSYDHGRGRRRSDRRHSRQSLSYHRHQRLCCTLARTQASFVAKLSPAYASGCD